MKILEKYFEVVSENQAINFRQRGFQRIFSKESDSKKKKLLKSFLQMFFSFVLVLVLVVTFTMVRHLKVF